MRPTYRTTIVSFGLVIGVAGAAFACSDEKAGESVDDRVDRYIRASMVRQHIPGLSLAVIRDGKLIKAKGYGLASVESNAQATAETVYELASATKPLVAMAVMMLVQDGKIKLDARLSEHLEGAPDLWRAITIRQLLSHTSGIKDYLADLRHDFPYNTSAEDFVQIVAKEPLKFRPGTKWAYSNTGYVVLGVVVKNLSGAAYDEYLKRRVFDALKMDATQRDSADEIIPGRASGYIWAGPAGLRNAEFLKYLMMNHGDRGIVSTVLDLATWANALETDQLLSRESREVMAQPVTLEDGSSHDYGLGWFLGKRNGHRHIYHPGGAPGTGSMISRYPDDRLTLIILTNGGATYAQALELGVAQRYIPDLVSRRTVRLDADRLNSYTGYYNAYGFQVLQVTREGDALVADDGGRLTNVFLPISESVFVAEDDDRRFKFTRDGRGEVLGMELQLGPDRMNVQRIGPLFGAMKPVADPDRRLTNDIRSAMTAMAAGGKRVAASDVIAPQARKDFARMGVSEFKDVRDLGVLRCLDVSGCAIERHGARVDRVAYCKIVTKAGGRLVLIYLTKEGLITDQDVITREVSD